MTLTLIRSYLGPYRGALAAVVLLLLAQAIGTLYLPVLNADIINNGVVPGDINLIISTGVVMLAISILVGLVSIAATYLAARTAMGFGRDVRHDLFHNVQGFSLAEMNTFGAPSLITRNTNDVQQVQMLVLTGQTMMISAPLMAFGGVFMALRMNVQLSALLFVIIPIMAIVIGLILRRAVPLFRSMQVKIDGINGVLRENLTGIRVIRAFVKTEQEERRFADVNADLTGVTLSVTRLFALMMPSLMLVFNLSSVAVIWFGGQLVGDGDMQIGDLTAFLAYIMQILFSVMMAVMLLIMIPRAAASAERIKAVLDTVPAIIDPAVTKPNPPSEVGQVELRSVEFRYPGAEAPVLCDLNLTCIPGQTTAIVGGTGSGKTTLVNLIPRLFDATAGSVRVNGVDVREQDQATVWNALGFVPQKSFLFSGDIASNLRFGRPGATDEQLWRALETAQAADFVRALPEGLAAPVDQGGANFSGGQRQRLAIARAVVRDPAIYVFDDSFSALDYATDARLRHTLQRDAASATVIIVAQRISTILTADQIVVLERGRVVGIGTHAALLERCETYAEIVSSQLTEAAQ
ncbi:MAG: ABC transporter ATP-binding protein/permease [Actinomycetia bacterium]|nr:ABC transporter ATP-binding protein/permease [Actinomycetes bacterium]